MQTIPLQNKRLIALLSNTIELFYTEELIQAARREKEMIDKESVYHGTSDEYLYEAFKCPLKKYAFPRSQLGLSLTARSFIGNEANLFDPIIDSTRKIAKKLGVQRNALIMCYPDDGYIGWHHNGNAPGHNILFSYSQDGDGGFYHWDYETKSIIEHKDQPGWNVKVGYYPSEVKEPDRVYWHMAKTKKQRVSIAFVIDHTEMWKSMIDDITDGNYDKSIITK